MLGNLLVDLFLIAAIICILVGAALKTAAEEDQDAHRLFHELMIAGLIALAFAILADKSL
jgi:hypothetical protein